MDRQLKHKIVKGRESRAPLSSQGWSTDDIKELRSYDNWHYYKSDVLPCSSCLERKQSEEFGFECVDLDHDDIKLYLCDNIEYIQCNDCIVKEGI